MGVRRCFSWLRFRKMGVDPLPFTQNKHFRRGRPSSVIEFINILGRGAGFGLCSQNSGDKTGWKARTDLIPLVAILEWRLSI